MAYPLSAWGAAWAGPPLLDVEAGAAHLRSHVEESGAGLIAAQHDLLAYQSVAHIGQTWGPAPVVGIGTVAPVKVLDGEGDVIVLEYPILARQYTTHLRWIARVGATVAQGQIVVYSADAAAVPVAASSAFVPAGPVGYYTGTVAVGAAGSLSHVLVSLEAGAGGTIWLESLSVVDADLSLAELP